MAWAFDHIVSETTNLSGNVEYVLLYATDTATKLVNTTLPATTIGAERTAIFDGIAADLNVPTVSPQALAAYQALFNQTLDFVLQSEETLAAVKLRIDERYDQLSKLKTALLQIKG